MGLLLAIVIISLFALIIYVNQKRAAYDYKFKDLQDRIDSLQKRLNTMGVNLEKLTRIILTDFKTQAGDDKSTPDDFFKRDTRHSDRKVTDENVTRQPETPYQQGVVTDQSKPREPQKPVPSYPKPDDISQEITDTTGEKVSARIEVEEAACASSEQSEDKEDNSEKASFHPLKELSRKLTKFEVEFAGIYLNILGIILLLVGFVLFFRYIAPALQGLFQVGIGGVIGLVLLVLGDNFYRRDKNLYAQAFMAGGFAMLFFSICAGFFFYNLFNQVILFGLILAWVITAGLSIFRYNSKFIALLVLVTIFLSPLFMNFSLSNIYLLFVYLIAVNLGLAIVAYFKNWDYYSVLSFLFTYAIFFYYRGAVWEGHTLSFLFIIYALFLISNNLMHFRLKTSSGYNLFVSYFNPVLFGAISYYTLLKYPEKISVLLFVMLGLIHLLIMKLSLNMEKEDPKFSEITKNNLILFLLFITASISYVPFLSGAATFFPFVAALWYFIALALIYCAWKYDFHNLILRRFSYLNLMLFIVQLIAVIPTVTDKWAILSPEKGLPDFSAAVGSWNLLSVKFIVYFLSIAAFMLYSRLMLKNRERFKPEDGLAVYLPVLSAIGFSAFLMWRQLPAAPSMLAYSFLMFLTFSIAAIYKENLAPLRVIGYIGSAMITLYAFTYSYTILCTKIPVSGYIFLFLTAAVIYLSDLPLANTKDWPGSKDTPGVQQLMSLLIIFSLAVQLTRTISIQWMFFAFALIALLILLLYHLYDQRIKDLRYLSVLILGVVSIVSIVSYIDGGERLITYNVLPLAGIFIILAISHFIFQKFEDGTKNWALISSFTGIAAIAVLMKTIYTLLPGQAGILLWFMTGLGVLLYVRKFRIDVILEFSGVLVLSFALLKTVGYDIEDLAVNKLSLLIIGRSLLYLIAATAILFISAKVTITRRYYPSILQYMALFLITFQTGYWIYNMCSGLDYIWLIVSLSLVLLSFIYLTIGIYENSNTFKKFGALLLLLSLIRLFFCIGDNWPGSLVILFVSAGFILVLLLYHIFRKNLGSVGYILPVLFGLVAVFSVFAGKEWLGSYPIQRGLPIVAVSVLMGIVYYTFKSYGKINKDWIVLSNIMGGAALAVLLKAVYLLSMGQASTFAWSIVGLSLLLYARKTQLEIPEKAGMLVLLMAFIKALFFDSVVMNIVDVYNPVEMTLSVIWLAGVVGIFFAVAKLMSDRAGYTGLFQVLALLVISFQVSFWLFKIYASLSYSQVILSAFWVGSSMIYLVIGFFKRSKVFRQFGLAMLLASVLKIFFVDVWVLGAYDVVTLFIILGTLLMATSFLYQKHKKMILEQEMTEDAVKLTSTQT
ncbi:MAG: DUF2339 domain-containing protein [Chloroflexi bacterium]|nr:DUF2339 domain-containing protein [Chloroflexota bacterium]